MIEEKIILGNDEKWDKFYFGPYKIQLARPALLTINHSYNDSYEALSQFQTYNLKINLSLSSIDFNKLKLLLFS